MLLHDVSCADDGLTCPEIFRNRSSSVGDEFTVQKLIRSIDFLVVILFSLSTRPTRNLLLSLVTKMDYGSLFNSGNNSKSHDPAREELFKRRPSNDTAINLGYDDYMGREQQSLHGAHRSVDELLMNGGQIMGRLREQRDVLKGVKSRVLDLANTLGLSNAVMNLIEKRSYEDKLILFGGMALFVILILLVFIYIL